MRALGPDHGDQGGLTVVTSRSGETGQCANARGGSIGAHDETRPQFSLADAQVSLCWKAK
jgi:hypothetical protein